MNSLGKVLALLLAILPAASQAGATIEGKVNLDAAPKSLPPAQTNSRNLKKQMIGPPDSRTAIVYLEGNFEGATNRTAKLEVNRYQFSPGLLAVQNGTRVEFLHLDEDYHSVFSLSKGKKFDLGRYRKGDKPATQTFMQPGVVRLFCEIHEHEKGTILVLDTAHFARTDKEGNFKLENLPVGSYKLKAWLEERTIWERAIELKEGETFKVDFQGK